MLSAVKHLCYCAFWILHYAQDDISAKEASIVVYSYITAQQQKGVGNYWISILLIVFTLNRLSYILFVVLLSVLF